MKILKSHSTKIVLVKQNQIPISKTLSPKYIEEFRNLFRFGGATLLQDPSTNMSGVTFTNGLYKTVEGKEISIHSLTIENRKINFEIEGSSKDGEAIYSVIKKFLSDLVDIEQEGLLNPVISVDETELISQLQFSAPQLFSSTLYNQMSENLLNKASFAANDLAKARLGNVAVQFQLDYEPADFALFADSRINISRKEFVIQVAAGYGVNDNIFATKAPLNTDLHVQFLEDLEKAITEKQ
jgi:hypothetical protein